MNSQKNKNPYPHELKNTWKKQFRRCLIDLFFPPACAFCKTVLDIDRELVCEECFQQLDLADKEGRCLLCCYHERKCPHCLGRVPLFDTVSMVWEKEGVPYELFRQFKEGYKPYLASSLAPFMALNLPPADVLVIVPSNPFNDFIRGFSPIKLLGENLSKITSIPLISSLKWEEEGFSLKKTHSDQLISKRIVLLDDELKSGHTLYRAGGVLRSLDIASLSAVVMIR